MDIIERLAKRKEMKNKKLLAIILLSLSFCFVSGAGYGEIEEWKIESKVPYIEWLLLKASLRYVMSNPTNFLFVEFTYSPDKVVGGLPEGVDIKGKIWARVIDTRGIFSYKSGIALREHFKKELETLYSYIDDIATDMDTDIVAIFVSKGDLALGYFYQGEYHVWEE